MLLSTQTSGILQVVTICLSGIALVVAGLSLSLRQKYDRRSTEASLESTMPIYDIRLNRGPLGAIQATLRNGSTRILAYRYSRQGWQHLGPGDDVSIPLSTREITIIDVSSTSPQALHRYSISSVRDGQSLCMPIPRQSLYEVHMINAIHTTI